MARGSKAASPPPTEPQVLSAMDLLIARVQAELARIPGLVPGSDAWKAALERRINTAFDGSWLLKAKEEVFTKVLALVQGGVGPVSKDDVDIA